MVCVLFVLMRVSLGGGSMRISTLGEPLTPPNRGEKDSSDLIDTYLQTRTNLKPSSQNGYKNILRQYHKYLGKQSPNKLNKKSFLEYKRFEGRSKDTVYRYDVVLRGYLAFLEGRV